VISRWIAFIALILTALVLLPFVTMPVSEELTETAAYYLEKGPEELGAANLVTSIIVTYRGLDTLGEVAVLFFATTGVGLLLGKMGAREDKIHPASEILSTGASLLYPILLLFGAYIFIHGHLTPGGGFQGGVGIATGFLLLLLSQRVKKVNHTVMNLLESLSGAAYVGIGAAGLFLAGGFLDNRILPLGEFGRLFSAGAIPLIYVLVGLKVGTELSAILENMKGREPV
jgi:multicomponent Na+:H+ antiporter subunit B